MRTEDIINKVFSRSFMGYDMEQVDAFLDELIDCIEQHESDKREMLSAIEYLLGKLERGDRLPVAEMRKAIGAGKPRPKQRAALPEHASAPREAVKPRPAGDEAPRASEKQKPAARAVRRGSGAAPARKPSHKPSQAPRVKRVAGKPEPVAIEYETQESAPVRENWLDELLSSLPDGPAFESEAAQAGTRANDESRAAAPGRTSPPARTLHMRRSPRGRTNRSATPTIPAAESGKHER